MSIWHVFSMWLVSQINRMSTVEEKRIFHLGEPLVLESSTKDIEVNEGDSAALICNAQGLFCSRRKSMTKFFSRISNTEDWMATSGCSTIDFWSYSTSGSYFSHLHFILIILFQGSQLHLHRVTYRDSGIYKCLGSLTLLRYTHTYDILDLF